MLKWNEEYFISFVLNGRKFSTPLAKGFSVRFEADNEKNRLISKGAEKVKISVRSWT